MRKPLYLLFLFVLSLSFTTGCGSNVASGVGGGTHGNATVSLSMTDDPPAGVSVLFFEVSLTNATLQSAAGESVSLLNNNTPVQIDVTQLQALSAFLSTANVPAGQYKSLSLTFANPQLVIYNAADFSLSNCAVGSMCQLSPGMDGSATVNLTSAPFPVTLSAGSPLGFLIDFHLNRVIQSDLSVDLGVSDGVTISELPPATAVPPRFGLLTGTVESVDGASKSFTLHTAWGWTFTIDTTSSTTYNNFPCTSQTVPNMACLAPGEIVQVQIVGVASGGALTASQVRYVQAQGAQTVEGTVLEIFPSPATLVPAPVTLVMMAHQNPAASTTFPIGGLVEVIVPPAATLSIDANGFTMPSGVEFANNSQNGAWAAFTVGQNLTVAVKSGSVSMNPPITPPSGIGPKVVFTASSVELEPSQMTGAATAVDDSTQSFTFGANTGPVFFPWPWRPNAVNSFNVLTTGQTGYIGFTPNSFDGLATGQVVSVNGWLFAPASGSLPQIVAQGLLLRPNAAF